MAPPQGSKTKQGYELQLGTNNLAPWLFTQLLLPRLVESAKELGPGNVRVVWVSSSMADISSPRGGVDMANLNYAVDTSSWTKYSTSKAGNILHAKEFARLYGKEGIVSVVSSSSMMVDETLIR
jgi:retinol dehydrogenase-12